MSDIINRITPEEPLDKGGKPWYCYEYRVDNEDFVSPWFDHPMKIFDYLSFADSFLITRRFSRTPEGILEEDGLGGAHHLPLPDLAMVYRRSGLKSAEDNVVS